jgi:ABC-type amino acid transport substrate-binding protein
MNNLIVLAVAAIVSFSLVLPAAATEPSLEKIKKTGILKLGYRENSPPFSFASGSGKPLGYSVELCQHVAMGIAMLLDLPLLETKWIPVTAHSRFDALQSGEIDIECGNTTQTLSRRSEFDFSVMTFVDGAGLLYRLGERPTSSDDMRGQRFAVVSGTTTERILDKLISASKLGARLIRVKDHDAAIAALNDQTATAYAADRTVLITTALTQGKGTMYDISSVQFSYEPYGLMLRRDADFRLAVDRTLSRLYRSGEIESILQKWFANLGKPTESINATIQLNALPE